MQKYGRKAVWIDCDYDYDAGLAAAEELIRRYPDTDGILASNDMAAMAVYKVLHQNGRRVPEDVQLVGFDNIEFSKRMSDAGQLLFGFRLQFHKGKPPVKFTDAS